MKSSFSNSQGQCVDVTKSRKGNIRIRDTKNKTGEIFLEFTPDEYEAFVKGIMIGELRYDKIPLDETDVDPLTAGMRAISSQMKRAFATTQRTPENLAYTNGRHAERSGWVPYTFEMFCRRFHHDPSDDRSRRLYESFQTGRRAEALEG